jgi:CrcB protein
LASFVVYFGGKMVSLLWVMGGGAVGSGLRYLIAGGIQGSVSSGFPYGTLAVNVVGCLLIGILSAGFGSLWTVSETTRLAVIIGVLGGFTTFSSFGNDTLTLLNAGRMGEAILYVSVSNFAGLLAVWLGAKIVAGS